MAEFEKRLRESCKRPQELLFIDIMIESKKIGQIWEKAWEKVKETTGKKVTSTAPLLRAKNFKTFSEEI